MIDPTSIIDIDEHISITRGESMRRSMKRSRTSKKLHTIGDAINQLDKAIREG